MPQTILYESPQFRVIEHACPPDGEIPAGVFRGPTVTFVRTGVGILEVDGERTVIDSNQIVCLAAGARFRVEHFHCKRTSCAATLELPLRSTSATGAKKSGWRSPRSQSGSAFRATVISRRRFVSAPA